jgi:glucose/mannose transport system substrate-binding protein
MGLLLELDNVAVAGNWSRVLFPTIEQLIVHRKHVMAVAARDPPREYPVLQPRAVRAPLKLSPPQSPGPNSRAAARSACCAPGSTPLAQSSEVVAGGRPVREPGAGRERAGVLPRAVRAAQIPPPRPTAAPPEALRRLRTVKGWIGGQARRAALDRSGRRVRAAARPRMMIMGDWAGPELARHTAPTLDRDYGCAVAPGSAQVSPVQRRHPGHVRRRLQPYAGPGKDGAAAGDAGRAGRVQCPERLGAGAARCRPGAHGRLRARLLDHVSPGARRCRRPAWCTAWRRTKPAATPSSPKMHRYSSSTTRCRVAEAQRRLGVLFRLFNLKN